VIRAAPVLVYGDVMLDVMIAGGVKRMSPEAPSSPVVSMTGWDFWPGGAANVAVAVAEMGGRANLIGVIGDDPVGQMLREALQKTEVDFLLMTRSTSQTTAKLRMVVDGAQLMRLDRETVQLLEKEDEDEILARVLAAVHKAHIAVISDYAKGTVTPTIASKLIRSAMALGVPVVVDAKQPAAPHFAGASVIKPNLAEIAKALGRPEPETDKAAAECAQALRKQCRAMSVVLTRGAKGLTIAAEPGEVHIEGHRVTAADVTGAGDAVAGALALALASGAGILDAARFANAAGAAAVTKRGTVPPTYDEVDFFYDCDVRANQRPQQSMAGEGLHGRVH
jgi:D-beta-D-heptose 7-phosphate kinase/D-beta-D-heptose 1-phosphate adenosyltransferase